jgi:hypothetical protein
MEGRSFVVLKDCSIVTWEEYSGCRRVSPTTTEQPEQQSHNDKSMALKQMNVIVPRKVSEYFKRETKRPTGFTGRTNTIDSINLRDYLDPSAAPPSGRRFRSEEEIIYTANSWNLKKWR